MGEGECGNVGIGGGGGGADEGIHLDWTVNWPSVAAMAGRAVAVCF